MMGRRSRKNMHWISAGDGSVLADSVRVADSFWKRLRGLQFSRSMPFGEVLWLKDCRSIHTAWMRFSIDVFFLDEAYRVVDVRLDVQPWRIVRPKSQTARHVIEAKSMALTAKITTGLETVFQTVEERDP